LESREVEATELRNGGELWEARHKWVLERVFRVTRTDGDARSSLVSAVQEAAKSHSVVLQSQKLIDPDTEGKPEEEPEVGATGP